MTRYHANGGYSMYLRVVKPFGRRSRTASVRPSQFLPFSSVGANSLPHGRRVGKEHGKVEEGGHADADDGQKVADD